MGLGAPDFIDTRDTRYLAVPAESCRGAEASPRALCGPPGNCRNASTSRRGGAPKNRAYSRLNCDGLS